MKKSAVLRISFIGLMAALVFAATYIRIIIPLSVGGNTAAIHFGNVLCLLSGFILGPLYGGLSAGIGSGLYDLTNPLYMPSAPFTLVFKFVMAFICGKIAYSGGKKAENIKYNIAGGITGALVYIALYLGRDFLNNVWFLNLQVGPTLVMTGWKALASTFNAALAVAVSVPLYAALKKAFNKSGIEI